VRLDAVRAIDDRRVESAVAPLMERLDDEAPYVVSAAAGALTRLKARRALPRIRELLRHDHAEVRGCAAWSVGTFGDAESIPELMALAENKDMWWVAVESLGKLDAREAIPRISPRLKMTADSEMAFRRIVLEALCRLDAREAVPEITPLLAERADVVRLYAAQALLRLNAREAAPRILEVLGRDDGEAERFMIQLLGEWECRDAAPALLHLLVKPSHGLDDSVLKGLDVLDEGVELDGFATEKQVKEHLYE
jgi:HEAT repeat protein